jgi:geranylgeranyl diphosphate synthase type II
VNIGYNKVFRSKTQNYSFQQTTEPYMPPNRAVNSDFNTQLTEKAQFVNNTLSGLIAKQTDISGDLKEAIRYTLEAGGKRVRSALVLWCCELISGGVNRNAEIAAAAIEMVHTYSLVHDDLPAMDDDDFRRGLPTCHKAFDEATALLTGDALLTLAFEVLAKEVDAPAVAVRLIGELAQAAGPAGMIAGQMADLKAENGPRRFALPAASTRVERRGGRQKRSSGGSEEILEYIHTNKTAKMFRCAAAMGAICGKAMDSDFDQLCEYGLKIGLGFQIADDILDICASSEHLGKTAGKDAKAGKITYPAVVGMKKSRQLGKKLADEAVAVLAPFGQRADTLRNLAIALLKRTR